MKFGKHIQAQTIPEWAPHYMNYKALKKIINELGAPLSPGVSPAEAAKKRLQTVKAAFFFQVDRELEKVNSFYLQKEADSKVRLKSLIEKQRALRARGPRNRTTTIRALHEAFLNSRHDLDKLQNFVEINGTGFRKILKKWDKRSKSSTKELYLARQVEVQPCFNQDIIAELSDTVTKCLSELEHALDEESGRIVPASMPTQLDLITSPSQDASVDMEPPAKQPRLAGESTEAADTRMTQGVSGAPGALLDLGVLQSVQVDRVEAELFQALLSPSAQVATDLLDKYKAQQTGIQKTCATRVLWRACSEVKDPERQQLILDSGLADLTSTDDINERTLAHEASIHGSLPILTAAVSAGCRPDAADYYRRQPVHYAAINNHEQCLKYLLEQGCGIRDADEDGSCAFDYALGNGHVGCARMLLDHDASIACGTPDRPALVLACDKGHEDIVGLLLDAGAEIMASAQGMHPLHLAARAGFSGIIRILIDHGAPVDVVDKDLGWTPVFYAANEGHEESVRVLLEAGCCLDILDENKRGPAYFAANEGHLGCADLLFKAAASRATSSVVPPRASGSGMNLDDARTAQAVPEPTNDSAGLSGALDLDSIPSLSLPPPLIPFRVYGHNFLGQRTRIHIRMHSHSLKGGPPVAFLDNRDMISLKLVVDAKPDPGMVPHTVMLPMETSSTTYGFQTDCLDQFRLEFQLYPSFGLQSMGKAVALPSLFTAASSGMVRLPLLDRFLKLVAEISFEFLVIRPFEGAQLQIGGKVETYWKSTNPGQQQNVPAVPGFSSPPSRLAMSSSVSISSAVLTSPMSVTESAGGGPDQGSVPVVVSSSLAAEHVCVQVQVCRDGVPVVSPRMYLDVGSPSGVKLHVHSLTYEEFRSVTELDSAHSQDKLRRSKPSADEGTAAEWHNYVYDSGLTLEEVLEVLPTRFGISIQVLDNSRAWSGSNSKVGSTRHDINEYVDAILRTAYADSQRKEGYQRNTVFCSYSPTACVVLNWKQPNYAVFLLTSGRLAASSEGDSLVPSGVDTGDSHSADAPSFGPPACHLSLKEAVRFARANNLLGIVCSASLLTRVPALVASVKDNGLFLVSYGPENSDPQLCAAQKSQGVDALISDGVLAYDIDDSVDYAI
ncbi:phosphate system positive regulatory protein pho81 [Coemansia sp. RSA 552]|nr:phosphate system positive regulatory protein pho81 [Coemansia sp. RSA 552]